MERRCARRRRSPNCRRWGWPPTNESSRARVGPSPMSHLTRLPLYPYLIAAYPLWFIYLRNFGQASVVSALWATLFVVAVVWLLQFLARYCFKSSAVAAVVVTFIV